MDMELTKFEKELEELYLDILPDKIYDAHFHISERYNKRMNIEGSAIDHFEEFEKKYLGSRLCGGMMMPSPTYHTSVEQYVQENMHNIEVAEKYGYDAGLLLKPTDDPKKVEEMVIKYPVIKVLKPYFQYAKEEYDESIWEANILDFAPGWMWELSEKYNIPVLVHMGHVQNMLDDDNNVEQINYICNKYKKAVFILAHCGLGHNVYKTKRGIKRILGHENLYFDCSGVTEALSIYYCMKEYGADHMLYGGDFNFGEDIGRIVSVGSNAVGLHPGYLDESKMPGCYKYQPFNNLIEGLFALAEAGRLLSFTKKDWNKVFYENGMKIIHNCR